MAKMTKAQKTQKNQLIKDAKKQANTAVQDAQNQANSVAADAQRQANEANARAQQAAKRQAENSQNLANTVYTQLKNQVGNYDFANRQNRSQADLQLKQNSRDTEADRFEAHRNLQNAALGLFGSMNQAMNGSTVGNMMRMLENRNDADNQTYWNQLQKNQNQVENAYNDTYNQNQVAKRDAIANALKTIGDYNTELMGNLANIDTSLSNDISNIRANQAANLRNVQSQANSNLRNINSSLTSNLRNITDKNGNLLYKKAVNVGTGNVDVGNGANIAASQTYATQNPVLANIMAELNKLMGNTTENKATISKYLMPDNSVQAARQMSPRNQMQGNDYYSRLINGFNGR